jgi:small subunit ribosomal protein S14
MAKKSSVEKNNRRRRLVEQYKGKRARLKAITEDETKSREERFQAHMKLAQLPRNSSKVRIRNRCELTGRSRAYYRKLKVCRNVLREMGSVGLIPGLVKSSW